MTVYRNQAGGVDTLVIQESEAYQTNLLPGFSLPLTRLLGKADLWPSKRRRPPAGGAP